MTDQGSTRFIRHGRNFNTQSACVGGIPGLVVMGGDSCSQIVGSNPTIGYWMDMVRFGLLYKMFVIKRPKTKAKSASLEKSVEILILF